MSDMLGYVEGFEEKLKSKNNIGYGQLQIPSQLDTEICNLIDIFIEADDEERQLITSIFSKEHSNVLLAFGERMAALAVRRKSRAVLLRGLLALLIEGWSTDARENIVVLSVINHSAQKLGVDVGRLFKEASKFATMDIARDLDAFLDRTDEDKSIESMGYKETLAEDGFRYECTW